MKVVATSSHQNFSHFSWKTFPEINTLSSIWGRIIRLHFSKIEWLIGFYFGIKSFVLWHIDFPRVCISLSPRSKFVLICIIDWLFRIAFTMQFLSLKNAFKIHFFPQEDGKIRRLRDRGNNLGQAPAFCMLCPDSRMTYVYTRHSCFSVWCELSRPISQMLQFRISYLRENCATTLGKSMYQRTNCFIPK